MNLQPAASFDAALQSDYVATDTSLFLIASVYFESTSHCFVHARSLIKLASRRHSLRP